MTCENCGHVEHYEDEESFFKGEMWGVDKGNFSEAGNYVICNNCLEK
jgi:hypothetical protein